MRRSYGVFILGLALAGVTACADDGPWQNPSVSAEQKSKDEAACRRAATQEADRDHVIQTEQRSHTRDTRSSAYMTQMGRFSAKRDREDLFDRCMARLGYTRAPRDDPKSRFEAQSAPDAAPQSQSR